MSAWVKLFRVVSWPLLDGYLKFWLSPEASNRVRIEALKHEASPSGRILHREGAGLLAPKNTERFKALLSSEIIQARGTPQG